MKDDAYNKNPFVFIYKFGEALRGLGDGRDRVRRSLADEPHEQRTALAASREPDKTTAERTAERRQDDLVVPEQPEHERGDDAADAEEEALVGATGETVEDAGCCVRIDGEVVDDAQNRIGHSDRIGSAARVLKPSFRGGRYAVANRRLSGSST